MYHPNRRYGNPEALRALTAGLPLEAVARMLHRHPRTIRDWLEARRKMPFWVPELLQLRHETALNDLRRMGIQPQALLHQSSAPHVPRPGRPVAKDGTAWGEEASRRSTSPGLHGSEVMAAPIGCS